ncbi:MAG: TrkH family potassium uptake protein, partial [Firmicutes bacterium]|nr:TrkH family potassium uptake protein [Bacillota bacterium]
SKSGLDSSFAGRSFSEVIKSREGNMLFLIYVSISLIMFIVMVCLGHVPLEALELTLTVCSTGGLGGTAFSAIDAGIKGTGAICIASMILSTISFTVYARLIRRDLAYVKKNTELRAYACLLVSSTLLICAANRISGVIPDIWQSFRAAGFHAVSFSSTTGLTNGNINSWPAFSKAVLCMLSFFGASSVSTGSGIKLIRIIIAMKAIRRSFYRRIHPRVVMSLRINGKAISDDTVDQVMSFIIHYALLFLAGCFVFSFSAPDLETAFFSSSSLINNLGSGFGAVGAECGYDFLGPFGKLFGCFLMLAGRLEIYALMLPFSGTAANS